MFTGFLEKLFSLFLILLNFVKSISYYIFAKLTGLKCKVYDGDFSDFPVKFNEADRLDTYPVFKELYQIYVLVKQKEIAPKVKLNQSSTDFKVVLPTIKISPSVMSMLRWNKPDLNFLPLVQNLAMLIKTALNELQNTEFALSFKLSIHKTDDKELKIKRKLKLTEEIVKFLPYVRKRPPSFVLKFPVIRQPLYKSYFTSPELEKFRENLARQSKTVRANIEIICIYDKINIESYSTVRQNPDNKELMLYLSDKDIKFSEEKFSYLVIGSRKDNKEVIKALVKLD